MAIEQIQPSNAHPIKAKDPVRGSTPVDRIDSVRGRGLSMEVGATTSDSVEISEASRELARALDSVAGAAETRADRVSELKQRIKDGTYTVPAELLAQRLLDGMPGADQ